MSSQINLKKEEAQHYDFDKCAYAIAAAQGCVVVLPKTNQLQIDIDTEEQYTLFCRRIADIELRFDWKFTIEEHFSRSGAPNRHITLTFSNKEFNDDMERIVLQMMLGSDQVRESLNMFRYLCGIENPTRLFETKGVLS